MDLNMIAYTEYFFDTQKIKSLVEERKKNLLLNRGFSDLLDFGIGVIVDRLRKDPLRYRDYGPYWFALKDILNKSGLDLGVQSDQSVKNAYHGESDTETLIMADEFRDEYLKTNLRYNNQFILEADSSELWTLYDSDMENPDIKI